MRRGFTLIELLVVIAIIGLLSSVVLASLNAARGNAKDAARISDMREIEKALALYALDNDGRYPVVGNWSGYCGAYGSNPNYIPGLAPKYISKLPLDPDGNPNSVNCCNLYYSDGKDYKLLGAHGCSTADYQSYPSLLDPLRDGGSSPLIIEPGRGAWSWSVYTSGATGSGW